MAVLAALLLLVPAHTQPRIPRALPPVEAVVRAVTLVVMQGVGVTRRAGGSRRGEGGGGSGLVVVWPSRRRPLQRVPPRCRPFLQVVKPKRQGRAVLQGGGGVDESVGQELAGLLQVMAVLDGVGQDARQQAHVLAFGFDVPWFEQRQVGEHEGDDSLLGLALPLTDHP